MRVAIAFADLAGYTRFTEEEGEEEALSSVERFVEGVTEHAARGRPRDQDDRRRGDGRGPRRRGRSWTGPWASASLFDERPEPRIGIHSGTTLYRDGDYFGREVNLASRVVARARGGEVLVTDAVVDAVRGLGAPALRGDRRGQAEGLRRAAPALPRDAARRPMSERPLEAARESGLVRAGRPLLVMLSGGGDSVCLLDVALRAGRAGVGAARELRAARGRRGRRGARARAVRAAGRAARASSGSSCRRRATCRTRARDARYALAERLAEGDYAAAHTRQRPGRDRALPARRVARARARCWAWRRGAAGSCGRCLRVTRDGGARLPAGARPRLARGPLERRPPLRPRARAPRRAGGAARAEPRRRAHDRRDRAPAARGGRACSTRQWTRRWRSSAGGPAVSLAALREQPPALRAARAAARWPGDRAARDATRSWRSATAAASSLDLGDGPARGGRVRHAALHARGRGARVPEPVALTVPGRARFGDWEVEAAPGGAGEVSVGAASATR